MYIHIYLHPTLSTSTSLLHFDAIEEFQWNRLKEYRVTSGNIEQNLLTNLPQLLPIDYTPAGKGYN